MEDAAMLNELERLRDQLKFEQRHYQKKCEELAEVKGQMRRLESENRFLRRILQLIVTQTNIESVNDATLGV